MGWKSAEQFSKNKLNRQTYLLKENGWLVLWRSWRLMIIIFLHLHLKTKIILELNVSFKTDELGIKLYISNQFAEKVRRALAKSRACYRVFIKYCIFSLKCCDFSELCQFCFSAGFLPALCVYTHWHRGITEKGQSLEYFKNFRIKHNI